MHDGVHSLEFCRKGEKRPPTSREDKQNVLDTLRHRNKKSEFKMSSAHEDQKPHDFPLMETDKLFPDVGTGI